MLHDVFSGVHADVFGDYSVMPAASENVFADFGLLFLVTVEPAFSVEVFFLFAFCSAHIGSSLFEGMV